MKKRTGGILVFLLAGVFLVGCGDGSTNPPGGGGGGSSAPVSVTVRDNPPAGVTVLSFEVTVTGAVLQPGNVSLVSTPIEIEIKRLETETAFLTTINVAAGTYTSITVTFSNPELTIVNNSGAALAGCANGAACELRPPLTAGSVSYNGAPFPLTVTANTPIGLLLDFDLFNSIPGNLANIAPTFTFSQLPVVQGTGQLEEIEDLVGRVTAKDTANNQFTLQVGGGLSLVIRVDNNTMFEDFNEVGCATANFACVAVGQLLEVDLHLMPGGVLLAKKVEAEDNDNEEELEGFIMQILSPTQFQMVLQEELIDIAGLDVGNVVVVNLLPGTQFRIDDDGMNVNSADFDAASDLMVGQTVEVEKKSTPAGTPPAFDTDRVKLKDTRFRATVQSVDTANSKFTLNNLPALFAALGITSLDVNVTSQTRFEDVAGLSALAPGNTVSVRALLFKGAATPFMLAKKVRKR